MCQQHPSPQSDNNTLPAGSCPVQPQSPAEHLIIKCLTQSRSAVVINWRENSSHAFFFPVFTGMNVENMWHNVSETSSYSIMCIHSFYMSKKKYSNNGFVKGFSSHSLSDPNKAWLGSWSLSWCQTHVWKDNFSHVYIFLFFCLSHKAMTLQKCHYSGPRNNTNTAITVQALANNNRWYSLFQ